MRGAVNAGARIPHKHQCLGGPVWTATVVPNRRWSQGIAFGTRFVAAPIALNGSTPGDMVWSDDGVTWHLASPGPDFGNGNNGLAVAYNPATSRYFLVGNLTTKRFVSADGKAWSDAVGQPNTTNQIRFSVWVANGEFIFATSAPNAVYSTPDGNNPVAHPTPETFSTGCYANGKHYGVCQSTRNVYTSVDKDTWTLLAETTNSAIDGTLKIIAGRTNQLVAIGSAQQNTVSYSHDGGATWHDSTGLPVPSSFYQDGIYAQGVFLIVDANGACYTSADGGVTFTLNASSLRPIGGADNIPWALAHNGNGLYAAIQATAAETTVAAVGHC